MNSTPGQSQLDRLFELVECLKDPDRFEHSVEQFETVETHISIVLLTGPFAYKFKKPLDLDFLDFSTLDRRREACQNELKLNRRTAPDFYLDVVSITGSLENPEPGGEGEAIEYAVKMKQFPQQARLDRVVKRGEVTDGMIDDVAGQLANVHGEAERVRTDRAESEPDRLRKEVEDTYRQLSDLLDEMNRPGDRTERVHGWLTSYLEDHRERVIRRTREGYVRDLHGDLHLENIAWIDERALFFDCIEFNESYRRIDVINELSFTAMDLERMGETGRSWRLVNRYLERTGDYGGVYLLPFFKAYRAMVRAMVTGLKRMESSSGDEPPSPPDRMKQFLSEMNTALQRGPSVLVMMHGLSGSGKTTLSQRLLQRMGGVRVRSDVERKRIHGMRPKEPARGSDGVGEGLYSAEATRRTYDRLLDLARTLLDTGYPVFVDATFLREGQRKPFFELAEEREVPVFMIHLDVAEKELRRRLRERDQDADETVSDADERVLEHQVEHRDPLTEEERERIEYVRAGEDPSLKEIESSLRGEEET